jgi:pantoate--beta-alanine ligase
VRQLDLPVQIVAGETTREPDGLAMSSRNGYLSAAERAEAPRLYRVLHMVKQGMHPDKAMAELAGAGWKPDYVEVRRRQDLAVAGSNDKERVVLGAARLGATRLIDNLEY